jgi:hypothetical protein
MESLLARATRAHVETDPFPHVVVEGALGRATADALLANLPPVDFLTEGATYGSNEYFVASAGRTLHDDGLAPVWRDFVALHSSAAFAREIFDLFGDHLPAPVRSITEGRGDTGYGVRGFDEPAPDRVMLDAQIALNTPVVGPATSVKGAHVDRPQALYGATYYLRHDDDPCTGGELQLLRMRGSKLRKFEHVFAPDDECEVVRTIPYAHDTFVCWPNSIDALHRVSPRSETPRFRCYANLLAEVEKPWYDWRPYQRDLDARRPKGRRKSLAQRIKARIR